MEFKMSTNQSLSVEQRLTLLEADVSLALNYVRAIAAINLSIARIRELEDEYEERKTAALDAG